MRRGLLREAPDETPGVGIHHQMVGQQAGRLCRVGVICFATCAQVADQPLQRPVGADEAAALMPIDRIAMNVGLGDAGDRIRLSPGATGREAAEPDLAETGDQRRIDSVPRRATVTRGCCIPCRE